MTFEEILLEAIDEGLTCLGEQTRKAVYFHLRNQYTLSKQDIPYRIEEFTEALEGTFQAGAKLIEIKIMKILFNKVGHEYVPLEKPESLNFTTYVYTLRNWSLGFMLSPTLSQPQRKCNLQNRF